MAVVVTVETSAGGAATTELTKEKAASSLMSLLAAMVMAICGELGVVCECDGRKRSVERGV